MKRKIYVVFGIFPSINVDGVDCKLPSGQYILPAFDNYVDAKQYAGNVFNVVDLEVPETDNQIK